MKDMYISSRRMVSHLGAMSATYGVSGAAPTRARILELGCGDAETLLTHALSWPESECIGIDLEPQAIEQAEQRRQQLGVENVALYALGLDVLVESEPGEFDYIIINGIFSLLPESERAALLSFAKRCLAARGVVALRWNCLPGSRDAKTLQDAIALHTAEATDEEATLSSARAMLVYLELTGQKGRENAVLNAATGAADNEFMLRYVHNFNDAVYLVDFNQQLTELGFQYVGDVNAQSELAAWHGEKLAEAHGAIIPGKGKLLSQQYLDFAVNRAERFSLLIPADSKATLSELPTAGAVKALHWAGCFKRFISESGDIANAHVNRAGQCYPSEDPLILSIMDVIGDAWPFSLSFEQIVQNTLLPEDPDSHREKVQAALETLFAGRREGLLFSYGPCAYNVQNSATLMPVPGLLAAVARDEKKRGFNLWGEAIALTAEEIAFLEGGVTVTDAASAGLVLSLRDKGALCGSARAWKKAFQRCLQFGDVAVLKQLVMTLLMFSSSASIGGLLDDASFEASSPAADKAEQDKINTLLQQANQLLRAGKNNELRHLLEAALVANPDDLQLLVNITRTYLLTASYHAAEQSICRLLAAHAGNWDFYYDVANLFSKSGAPFFAGRVVRTILRNAPAHANSWDLLSCLYRDHGNSNLGIVCAKRAAKLQPRNGHYLTNLGILLSEKQKMAEALKYLKKAVEVSDNHLGYYSNYLFVLTHDPATSPEMLYREHLNYGDTVDLWAKKVGVRKTWKGSREANRKLRVGFISGDFVRHPVSNFFIPFWDAMNRDRFDLVGYHACPTRDDVTDYLEKSSFLWRDIVSISDPELAQQIYDDEIDILIDLSGHTTHCRLPMFGLRPAPIQMTWIGYPGTTGMKTIDYRILPDTIKHVPNIQAQFSENILYVPMEKTFEPWAESPDVNALPALKNGYITFGSFNRPKKLNNQVLRLWASILVRLPSAKLLIGFMDDPDIVTWVKEEMASHGVNDSQLILRARMPMADYLAEHHHVDIMLDAFPYTGGTTTNHAAWMGVPTLSLLGKTIAGCQGLDIMYTYGLEQFVAFDESEYFAKAVYWAEHAEELSQIRASMRSKIPTHHAAGFNVAETFETGLRMAWEIYCRGEAPRPFAVEK